MNIFSLPGSPIYERNPYSSYRTRRLHGTLAKSTRPVKFLAFRVASNMMENIIPKFVLLVLSFIIIVSPAMQSEKIMTISGSTSLLPLVAAAAEAFNDQQKEYFVTVTGGGTQPGIIDITEHKVDIAMVSGELTKDEKDNLGNNFQEHPIGYGDIVVALSPAIYNAGITDLTSGQIKKIYQGNITNWKDLGGPDERIYVIARMPGSGTMNIFNDAILGDVNAETPGVSTNTLSDGETETAIEGSDKAIGYLGLIYAQTGNIKPIAIDGIRPGVESLRNGAYKLTRKLSLYTYGDSSPGVKRFINFLLSAEGQEIVKETGFTPLNYIAA
jgi:phosphate transport system substrate-binding protein